MSRLLLSTFAVAAALLAGCDMLGIESPEKVAAARDAEGKAVGAACRHAGRAIEVCYVLNRRTDKAAIFAGWRDMNDYMRENRIESVPPLLMAQGATGKGADGARPSDGKPADTDPAAKPKAKDSKTGS
jgi:hypothetical protein